MRMNLQRTAHANYSGGTKTDEELDRGLNRIDVQETLRDLPKAALRRGPDRIIVGEVRTDEAFDLLQALNIGHAGSLCILHANSAQQAIVRFAGCLLQSGTELPS